MYIDPNTGGLLFQALAAAFAVLSGVLLVFSRQIRAAFARLRRSLRESFQDEEGTAPPEPSSEPADDESSS